MMTAPDGTIDQRAAFELPGAWLAALDESTVAFVQGIVNDADMEESDKCEALHGFLVDALESDIDTATISMVVREAVAWNRSFAERIAAADRDRTLRLARDLERATLHEDLETTAAGSLRPTLSADERRRRDALLEQYAFGSERLVEGANGALEVIAAPGAAHTTDPPLLGDRNTNAERVHLAQQEQRRQAKAEHEQRVERDRQLLDDQRRKQERAKERTQKREKRRM